MKKFQTPFLFILTIGVIYILTVFTSGCAQIGMPVGGPKDTIPPVLVSANPPNKSLDFKGNKISLTFDEYIQLDNPIQNVIVSPLPRKQPFIDYKLKTVTVKLYDTLQPDKTYSLQFGNTIKDLNEGNPFKGFDYVFSTGKTIDSFSFSGNVLLAESGKIDSTLTVMLYSDLSDSAVCKNKPEYIARLNKSGNFTFRYISPGNYNIFALKDEGGQFIYNNPEQLFAFDDSVLHLNENFKEKIQLYAYQEEKPAAKPTVAKTDTTLKFSTNLKAGTQDLLEPLILTFNNPLKKFDSSVAILTDTLFKPVGDVRYSVDSTGKVITVAHNWPGGTDFRFFIPENAATDTSGHSFAKNDTLKFKTKNESDYGSIKLTFKNLEKYQNPVLQLVPESGTMESYPLLSNVFTKKLVTPGSYAIQILEDKNKNGKWDPGDYAKRIQPEIVHRLAEPLTIRANWDNERDIEL